MSINPYSSSNFSNSDINSLFGDDFLDDISTPKDKKETMFDYQAPAFDYQAPALTAEKTDTYFNEFINTDLPDNFYWQNETPSALPTDSSKDMSLEPAVVSTKRKISSSTSEVVKIAKTSIPTEEKATSSTSNKPVKKSKVSQVASSVPKNKEKKSSVKVPEENFYCYPPKLTASHAEKLNLEKEVQQYNALIKKFKGTPNFCDWYCIQAVISAYKLPYHGDILINVNYYFETYFGKKCDEVELNKNVEDKYTKLLSKVEDVE